MANVYSPPAELGEPPSYFEDDSDTLRGDAYFKAVDEYIDSIGDWCKENGSGDRDLIGERISFGVADGRATYVVYTTKPVTLIWVPGDYQLPAAHERGLRLADVRQAVARTRSPLFGRRR